MDKIVQFHVTESGLFHLLLGDGRMFEAEIEQGADSTVMNITREILLPEFPTKV